MGERKREKWKVSLKENVGKVVGSRWRQMERIEDIED